MNDLCKANYDEALSVSKGVLVHKIAKLKMYRIDTEEDGAYNFSSKYINFDKNGRPIEDGDNPNQGTGNIPVHIEYSAVFQPNKEKIDDNLVLRDTIPTRTSVRLRIKAISIKIPYCFPFLKSKGTKRNR